MSWIRKRSKNGGSSASDYRDLPIDSVSRSSRRPLQGMFPGHGRDHRDATPISLRSYQIDTRVWFIRIVATWPGPVGHFGRAVPEAELERLAMLGVDWVWLLSVWQDGPGGTGWVRGCSGGERFQKPCPTCRKRTFPAPVSRLPGMPCISIWEATRPWPACASGSNSGA